MKKFKLLSLSIILVLTSCAQMDPLSAAPKVNDLADYEFSQSFQAMQQEWLGQQWWLNYQDNQLTTLINEGLTGSPGLEQAAARVQLAQAAMQGSRGNLLPDIRVNAGSNHTNTEHVQGWHHYNLLALNLQWELDFFGKNRNALAAAVSGEKAARAEEEQARLILTTQIANQYAALFGVSQLQSLAQKTLKIRQSTANLVNLKYAQGLETAAAAAQATSVVTMAEADVIALDNQAKSLQFSLAALLGKGPDRGLAIDPAKISPHLVAHKLPDNIQSNLLSRRPDIVASRYRAEAAAYRVGYAKALFYPTINLTALAGFQALDNADILTAGAHAGQIFPTFSLPIFSGGKLNANLKGAKAEYDLAVAQYNNTLTRALQEVATEISTVQAVEKQKTAINKTLEQANRAYQLILTRYKGGLTTYLEVLNAENGLIQAKRAAILLQQQAFNADVGLIKALGGGYQFKSEQ